MGDHKTHTHDVKIPTKGLGNTTSSPGAEQTSGEEAVLEDVGEAVAKEDEVAEQVATEAEERDNTLNVAPAQNLRGRKSQLGNK